MRLFRTYKKVIFVKRHKNLGNGLFPLIFRYIIIGLTKYGENK